jgi:F420-non-reducing hydrogenase small subunit
VEVDYLVGGCPPHHAFVTQAVHMVLQGNLPPVGSWLTSGKAVCDACSRNPANEDMMRKPVSHIKRTIEGVEETGCLLQHGLLCLGPVTQGDCNGSCPKVSMPCRGCGGPMPGIEDYGAQAVSAIGAILDDETAAQRMLEKYPNLAKVVYRYALPASYLGSKL